MERKVYISDSAISLCEYVESEDDDDCYHCWQDPDTQKAYNYKFTETFEAFSNKRPIKSRFVATIIRCSDHLHIGSIFVSPENTPPDLAIMIYKPFRNNGYGTKAFSLGTRYCFETLGLDRVFAGYYPDNTASRKMLLKCGFQPHPEGNLSEKHFLTGEDITQLDFVKYNPGL